MHDEEKRVEPVLGRPARLGMNELVLCDEDARPRRERRVHYGVVLRRRHHEDPRKAGEQRQRIEGMAEAFPAAEAPPPVEMQLVEGHGDGLDRQRKEGNCRKRGRGHVLTINAPETVSPGPNAMLATSVPGATRGSAAMLIQIWGSVADDMLP